MNDNTTNGSLICDKVAYIPVWVDNRKRCPHCGGLIERRGDELYCFGCHFWWEDKDEAHNA